MKLCHKNCSSQEIWAFFVVVFFFAGVFVLFLFFVSLHIMENRFWR